MRGVCGGNLCVAVLQHACSGQRTTFLSPLCGFGRAHSGGQVSHLQCSKSRKVFSGKCKESQNERSVPDMVPLKAMVSF